MKFVIKQSSVSCVQQCFHFIPELTFACVTLLLRRTSIQRLIRIMLKQLHLIPICWYANDVGQISTLKSQDNNIPQQCTAIIIRSLHGFLQHSLQRILHLKSTCGIPGRMPKCHKGTQHKYLSKLRILQRAISIPNTYAYYNKSIEYGQSKLRQCLVWNS